MKRRAGYHPLFAATAIAFGGCQAAPDLTSPASETSTTSTDDAAIITPADAESCAGLLPEERAVLSANLTDAFESHVSAEGAIEGAQRACPHFVSPDACDGCVDAMVADLYN